MMAEPITGLVAAVHTPVHPDGRVRLELIERQFELLRHNGVGGAFVCGTTGESMSLNVLERMAVAERWLDVADEDYPVIVHVGHNCLVDCRALAEHAARVGAHAIAAMGPTFFKPATVEDLVAFCAEVAAAAPELPFYYYHIPAMTGLPFRVSDFLEAASGPIPTLAGAKFTFEDLMDFHRCLTMEGGRFNMLFGRDEILLSGLALGAGGGVGSTYNYAAPVYLRVMEAFEAGDVERARAEQARARDMVEVLRRFGGVAAGKAIMALIGLDCGPCRLPLRTLDDGEQERLRAELEAIGFFDFCCQLPEP